MIIKHKDNNFTYLIIINIDIITYNYIISIIVFQRKFSFKCIIETHSLFLGLPIHPYFSPFIIKFKLAYTEFIEVKGLPKKPETKVSGFFCGLKINKKVY